jgi:putative aldouronate transport system permease protein
MIQRRSFSSHVFNVFNVLLMVLVVIVTLYPLLYVIFASFSSPVGIYQARGFLLFPREPHLEAYRIVFHNPSLLKGYRNTLFFVSAGTLINLVMTSLGAYVLSRKNLMWKRPITLMILFTMYFSGGLIPLFLTVKQIGMMYSPLSILLVSAINTWNLMIMKTSFQQISEELIESARIDGAQDFTILARIMVPLSLPVIAVMALFYGVGRWNSWFYEMIFLHRDWYPLQVVLQEILLKNTNVDYLKAVHASQMEAMRLKDIIKYAVIVVATVPILFSYPLLQKYFVKGIMIGSLKG